MIVYGASISPFVRKALAFAAEKGVAVESKMVGLGSNDPEFLEASPFRKIPALRDGGYTLADSSAIVAYIEAVHPEPNLIPTEPKARGKAMWWDEFADTILIGVGAKIFFNRVVAPRFLGQEGDLAAADHAWTVELPPILQHLEASIPASGHLVEDRLTLADLAVASPFANLRYAGCELDAALYPKLTAFVAAMFARPSFGKLLADEAQFFGG